MKSDADIAALGACGLGDAFALGEVTPEDAFAAYARRVRKYNESLNAFLHLRLDEAKEEAQAATERWRSGAPLSPIDGVPFGVKANISVAGLPWHGGIGAYRDRLASEDAQCIANLRRAGAIPLGILNMHEGALGATSDNPHFGRCHNPWGDNLTPGGSSGGSGAAVAAGLCAFALGTDTMGSVRIPSAYCGIAGLKPTRGAVSNAGLVDLSPTLDHIGPHARSAADLALIIPHLSGKELSSDTNCVRFGIADWRDAVDVDTDVASAFAAAANVIKTLGETASVDISIFEFGALRRRGLLVSEVEGYEAHKKLLAENRAGFSDDFAEMLEWGAGQPRHRVDAAHAAVQRAGDTLIVLLKDIDVIAAPTAPQRPFPFGDQVPANQADFTCIANFAGAPSVAVPATIGGAPAPSIQFIANPDMDHIALYAALRFEEARGATLRPPNFF